MAIAQSLPELLNSLTSSLTTLSNTLPSEDSIISPESGISLLDTKNELLLSYLQNLVFLILLKIRNARSQLDGAEENSDLATADEVVNRLVELRVYLERGVRPLESKIRYQIDQAVRAAESHESQSQQSNSNGTNKRTKKATFDGEDSSSESQPGDNEPLSDSDSSASAEPSRPALSSMITTKRDPRTKSQSAPGVYRPPRIAAVAPPSSISTAKPKRIQKSRLLDDYISTELSNAPTAEPSIGANILDRGRGDIQSVRERKMAAERQRYEEENLIRLPGMGKKERRRVEGERLKRGQFGGEEWNGLGETGDRIVELTKRRRGGDGISARGALERSRKRPRDEDDGSGYSGRARIGEEFERKRRVMEKRANRKR